MAYTDSSGFLGVSWDDVFSSELVRSGLIPDQKVEVDEKDKNKQTGIDQTKVAVLETDGETFFAADGKTPFKADGQQDRK